MRIRFTPFLILFLFFTFTVSGQKLKIDSPNKDKWVAIDSLMNLGLIKTAEPQIFEIYKKAKSENKLSDYFKSLNYKIEISKTHDDFDINTVVDQLKTELNGAPSLQKQILHSILAEVYTKYYQQNRWNIQKRTDLHFDLPKDIKIWTPTNFQSAIRKQFLASLTEVDKLSRKNIENIEGILKGEVVTRDLRPTLYDLLAHRFINYFLNTNLLSGNSINKSDINLDYFLPVKKYLELEIDTIERNNSLNDILKIYQQLLLIHQNDENKAAFINADLDRLKFVKKYFLYAKKQELNYLNALNNIITSFPQNPSSSLVQYEKARIYAQRGNRYDPFTAEKYQRETQKAADICQAVTKDFPKSEGANYCREMLKNLEATHLNLTLKSIQLPKTPMLASVDYKNCPKLYFKIISLDFEKEKELSKHERLNKRLSSYLTKEAIEEWSQNLPDKNDMQSHNVQIRLPELQIGYYILLTSSSPEFNEKDLLHSNYFWVSGLSFISRNDGRKGLDIFVLDRKSGHPLQNVKLEVSERSYSYKTRKQKLQKVGTYFSDKYGFIHLLVQPNYNPLQFLFSYKKDTLVETSLNLSGYRSLGMNEAAIQTRFFTDRKIYRPGQTVYFKGIVVEKQQGQFKVVAKHKTKVIFQDANRQEVSSQEFYSNEFGSFRGSFIIPRGVLNGNMQLKNENGNLSFSVEEYKRPNFEIRFDTLKLQYRINDTVTISGLVRTYSGSTLGNTQVKFTLTRSSCSYFKYDENWFGEESDQLTSGEIKTNDEGRFQIRFLAAPDGNLDESLKMVYNYQMKVVVTDLNGETQSAEKKIPVSYTNLKLSSSILEILEKNNTELIPVSAVNFNGEKQEVNVSVSIFKLENPSKAFVNRKWRRPDQFVMDRETFYSYFPNKQYDDEIDKRKWGVENQVFQAEINTGEVDGFEINNLSDWENGAYKIILKTLDQNDEEIESKYYFTLYSAESNKLAIPDFYWFHLNADKAIPGDTCYFVIGSFAKNASVLYELQQHNKVLVNKRIKLNREQKKIEIPITRNHIGQLNINIIFIKDNEVYTHNQTISVSDPEQKLKISLETFRPILQPGQAEEWKIKISGNNDKTVIAELLCTMTDVSLETFRANRWNLGFRILARNRINWNSRYGFGQSDGRYLNRNYYGSYFGEPNLNFEDFFWNYSFGLTSKPHFKNIAIRGMASAQSPQTMQMPEIDMDEDLSFSKMNDKTSVKLKEPHINIRKNFSETAFFYPDLQTDKNGNIILKFTSPEALTRWKFMALAHTKDLRTALLEQEVVTQKELMVSPNIPRFFRQGDTLYFNAKISNLSEKSSNGRVELQFFNAENRRKIENVFLDGNETRDFEIKAKSNISKEWKILIPDNVSAVIYRLTASTKDYSDGEERMIPVLSNRILVTESLPIHINANESKTMRFERLLQSDSLQSIKNHSLKLEMTSNPNWYAIQALPMVAETNQKNAIALFNCFYANAMASHILNANPQIRQVFEQWKALSPDTFLSNLEKNQELKSVLLAETPWVLEAQNDSERKHRLALFFDLNTMGQELKSSLTDLLKLQLYDGSWSWYKGGRGNRYITQHILVGVLRLHNRGVLTPDQWKEFKDPILNAIHFLNQELKNDFNDLKEKENIILDNDHLRNIQIQYLFSLSYADEVQEKDEELQMVYAYYLDQAQKYWTTRNNYLQGMIALILSRNGDKETADLIIRSLKERSSNNEEMGMYWKQERGYYWYQEPIETQALLIEAFLEINADKTAASEMKKWLIKQKQTQLWGTAKASVEAVNALLLDDENIMLTAKPVQVKLGSKQIEINKQEAGTGFYEISWNAQQIKAEMGTIQLKNRNNQMAWGALHWQYFEDVDKILSYETPLKIEKQLFVKQANDTETVLIPIDENKTLKVGDKVVSRIVIRVDRDMEFVHLKDMRASAFEPRNVLSHYRYQNGLGYYESTKDAATHFYFDRLRKGTYVFEYEMFVSQKGEFSNGVTSIQCMYAPEFMSHSEGIRVVVSE